MKEIGLEIINKIHEYGYVGYIVGGFVRDMLLKKESKDVDITTNATTMEFKNIFPDIEIVNTTYGAVILHYKGYHFDITTFRKEEDYLDNRHPSSVTYVNDLETDLRRRDFTINALCLDKDGNVIDLVGGINDLNNNIIKSIGSSDLSFKDDALRILRAIRFSSYLNFKIDEEVLLSIEKNKELLKKISYNQKKKELDKIFGSNKAREGIELIKQLGLDKILELDELDRVKDYSDILGIWAMINTKAYPFSNLEKESIDKINLVYEMDNLNNEVLYEYGLYVNVIAGINKGIDKKSILEKYEALPIKRRDEIKITAQEMCDILKKEPGKFISKIYEKLEKLILNGQLENDNTILKRYIMEEYHE